MEPRTFLTGKGGFFLMLKVQKKEEAEDTHLLQAWPWSAIFSPFLLIIIAWGIILVAFALHQIIWLNHDFLLQKSHFPWIIALIIFIACWQVMILAMMLPSVLPLLFLLGDSQPSIMQRWREQGVFIFGYALVWTAFALIAFLGDTGIHWLVANYWWLYLHSWVIGTVLLGCAGLFQLCPFKQQCLQQCCFPFAGYLPSDHKRSITYKHGIRYGASCLGSCWALMLVQFGLGMSSVVWMALGTAIVMGEKGIVGRQRFSLLIGGTFLLLALLWAVLPSGWLSNL
jgi:predicted metal-binding membrane protein